MGLRIKTNVEALTAQRKLAENREALGRSLERMSSGKRINKSADDAAGLAVSERLRAKSLSLDVAKRNASDGVSYIQVAEGGLSEITNNIVRMRELASQAASDTIGNREREFLNKEFQQLRQEVGRIVKSTEFNGARVLQVDDNEEPIRIFVGASNRASDADGKAPVIPANEDSDVLTIDLSDLQSLTKVLSYFDDEGLSVVPASETGGAQDLGEEGTADLLNKIDTALNSVAAYRATLGSVQARLNSAITNIDVSSENILAAQSRISDVDYASETAKFAQARILTQAGVSVLTQANSTPEYVLQLLR
jgi:flagellin